MAKSKAYHNGEHSAHPVIAEFDVLQTGMTKREAFAMAAMQGMLSNNSINVDSAMLSSMSTVVADALLAELEK